VKKFAFNLEKALRLRAWTEDEARVELGRAVGELEAVERNLRLTAEKRAAALAEHTASARGIRDFCLYQSYLARLDVEKEKLLAQAAEAALKVDAAREIWSAAKSERTVLENLKERRFAEYRKAVFAEEEKELDGLGASKFQPLKQA
jgi:flagellar FliJ protein